MKFDVIICTKDRPEQLKRAVARALKLSHNRVIVVDSSECPSKFEDVTLLHTPNVNIGCARRIGLSEAKTDVVFFVDDDVVLTEGCVERMATRLREEGVVGVSGRVVYGWRSDEVLFKLTGKGRRPRGGGSGGLVLFKRQPIIDLGSYNPHAHWGEDSELHARIKRAGFKWIRELSAVAYHKCTFKQFLKRAFRNGIGAIAVYRTTKKMLPIALRYFGRATAMPLYYMMETREPRVLIYYGLFNLIQLCSFLRGLNKNDFNAETTVRSQKNHAEAQGPHLASAS